MDLHLIYVGMTRHRDTATIYAGLDDFKDEAAMARRLGRARPKASTLDFAERRGFETSKAWTENARAWVDLGRERLNAAWTRAEQVFAATRDRVEALRARFSAPEQTANEEERVQDLQKAFRPDPKAPEPSSRREQLREQFGQEQAGQPAKPSEAQRQTLRDAFKEEPAVKKMPEQVREAMQQPDKPAVERRQGKDKGLDQSK